MSVLYGLGLGALLAGLVVVMASMLSSQISQEEEERRSQAEQRSQAEAEPPPAQCRRAKVLWVDGQPTMSYSIVRLPRYFLN